jgi:enamine deaminase RidA (YjgF/YER057c/UK114 family)
MRPMGSGTGEARVQTLLPQVFRGNVLHAAGVRAGRWIFATGVNGLFDYATGAPSNVVRERLPHWDTSKLRREADQIFRNLDAVMVAGGGGLENAVRLDQNYTSGRAVEAYHDARRAMMKDHIAPSTSTLIGGFLRPAQEIEVHMIGSRHRANSGRGTSGRRSRRCIQAPATASRSKSVITFSSPAGWRTAGSERVWRRKRACPQSICGKASDSPGGGVHHREKIAPALKAAGSSLDDLVKCQVYMRDVEDFGPFNDVWSALFPHGSR